MTYLSLLKRLAKSEDIKAEWRCIVPENSRGKAADLIGKWIYGNWQFRWSIEHGEDKYWFMPRGKSSINKEDAIKLYKFFFIPEQIIKTFHWE